MFYVAAPKLAALRLALDNTCFDENSTSGPCKYEVVDCKERCIIWRRWFYIPNIIYQSRCFGCMNRRFKFLLKNECIFTFYFFAILCRSRSCDGLIVH
jgi:hypothetical protein